MIKSAITLIMLFSCLFSGAVNKYKPITDGSTMSFILLNHSRLSNEIKYGSGNYLQSLSTQANINITELRILLLEHPDPYQFAKAIVER